MSRLRAGAAIAARRRLASAAAALALLAVPAAIRAQAAGPRPVRIATGLIEGLVAPGGVREFRGIPFAAPPVGQRRWQPPAPAAPWRGVRRAEHFGPRCMQLPLFGDMVFRSDGMSEDCLYLNVWAPPPAAGRRRPVLVYFFGGGYLAGDGSEYRYDGASLARRGVVVVTVNYRLGVFGFLALPALTAESPHHASGDYGLLDQAAALRWVRRNIAAFGGDPRRVTIGGESAGSVSVCALMASPLSRDLIAGAIGESGGMITPIAPALRDSAEQRGARFVRGLGETTLVQLRALPADSLLRATRGAVFGTFPPTVDGWFLPASPAEIFAAGKQAQVPLLVGWNSQESSWQALLGAKAPTPANWAEELRTLFPDRADEALRVFPGADTAQVEASGTLLASARFTAFSTWKWAELQARTGRPVYRYFFAHPRPAPKVPQPTPPPPGAVHSAEIEYALGNLATNQVYPWAPADEHLSAVMEGYVANFVTTGDPNGAGLPRWPAAFSGDTVQVMVLDTVSRAGPARHRAAYRFLDAIYFPATTSR
jgi:para-nitrobenzyl esterase